MARPINKIKRMDIPEKVIQEQNIVEVMEAVSQNKDAILKGIDLLTTANDSGGLDIVDAFIKYRKVALEKFIDEINKERYAGSLENVTKLFIAMGSIQIDEVQPFVTKINKGIQKAQTMQEDEKISYMGLLKALKDPHINRSITMLLQFLREIGKE